MVGLDRAALDGVPPTARRWRALDDPVRLTRVETYMAYLRGARGEHHVAIEAAEQALAAQASSDQTFRMCARIALGRECSAIGDYRRGIDCSREAVSSMETLPRRRRFYGGVQLPTIVTREDCRGN